MLELMSCLFTYLCISAVLFGVRMYTRTLCSREKANDGEQYVFGSVRSCCFCCKAETRRTSSAALRCVSLTEGRWAERERDGIEHWLCSNPCSSLSTHRDHSHPPHVIGIPHENTQPHVWAQTHLHRSRHPLIDKYTNILQTWRFLTRPTEQAWGHD